MRKHIIRGLAKKENSELYEITENGITYSFSYTMMVALKNYLGIMSADGKIAEWYNSLSVQDKKEITREGNFLKEDDGFFADAEWD